MDASQSKPLKLNLKSRLPSQTGDGGSLPQLSPKTPNVLPVYQEMMGYSQNKPHDMTMQTAMEALDMFGAPVGGYIDPSLSADSFPSNFSAMDPNPLGGEVHGSGLSPAVDSGPLPGGIFLQNPLREGPALSTIIEHQRTDSLSPGSQGDGSRVVSPGYNELGISSVPGYPIAPSDFQITPHLSTNSTSSKNGNSDTRQQNTYPVKPRGSRKKTLSLNMEEREALENLIEDVIIGGVADSDESSISSDTEDEKDQSKLSDDEKKANKEAAKEGMPKIYPAQLKVAVKHMRNLPPRFMRRLENAQKKIDAAERIEAERMRDEQQRAHLEAREKEMEKIKVKEVQMKSKKKEIRNLLDDLDQYTDEQSVIDPREEIKVPEKIDTKKDKHARSNRQKSKASPADRIQESSQPVHIGLSKGTANNRPVQDLNDLTQQLQNQQFMMSGQPPPSMLSPNAVNCEDLERELLGHIDHQQLTNANQYPTYDSFMAQNAYQQNAGLVYPNMAQQSELSGMMEHTERSGLSVTAAEFVPFSAYNMTSQPQVPSSYQAISQHLQGSPLVSQQMYSSPLSVPNSSHLIQQRSMKNTPLQVAGAMGNKFKPVPQEGTPLMSVDMLRNQSSSPFQASMGRMSPQVVNANMGRLSPHVMPVSSAAGVVHSQPNPLSSDNQSLLMHGKNPPFIMPKIQTNIPPPVSGVGMMPMQAINPYSIPYNYAAAAGMPPQGFPFRQPFLPPHGFMPWSGDPIVDKHGSRGPMHHPLMGIPLKASPQMGRKRGGSHHHGSRPGAPGPRPGFVQHGKAPPSDVKVMDSDSAKKLVQQHLNDGKKIMVILRGCPGSGKTTLARSIVFNGAVLATDDFFLNDQGEYEYDLNKIGDAHAWNQLRTMEATETGINPIIVDNTNTQGWEMKAYVAMAQKTGYHIEIIEPDTPWRHNAKELAKRNNHGVTLENIRKMLDRYEHSITLQSIMGSSKKGEDKEKTSEQQADGEQTGKKNPRRRKKKKRKRNRRRDKNSSTENVHDGQEQKHTTDESSDEEISEKSAPARIQPSQNIPSLTNTEHETTTSPRDTTPEVGLEDPFEGRISNTVSDDEIKENINNQNSNLPAIVELDVEITKEKSIPENGSDVEDFQEQNVNMPEDVNHLDNPHDALQNDTMKECDDNAPEDSEKCVNNDKLTVEYNDSLTVDLLCTEKSNENSNDVLCSETNEILDPANILQISERIDTGNNNSSLSSEAITSDDFIPGEISCSGLDIKREVTKLLEEHIIKGVLKKELARVVVGSHNISDSENEHDAIGFSLEGGYQTENSNYLQDLHRAIEDMAFDDPKYIEESISDRSSPVCELKTEDINSNIKESIAKPGITHDQRKSGLIINSIPVPTETVDIEASYWSRPIPDPYTIPIATNNVESASTDCNFEDGDPTNVLEPCPKNGEAHLELDVEISSPPKPPRTRRRERIKSQQDKDDQERKEVASNGSISESASSSACENSLISSSALTDSPNIITTILPDINHDGLEMEGNSDLMDDQLSEEAPTPSTEMKSPDVDAYPCTDLLCNVPCQTSATNDNIPRSSNDESETLESIVGEIIDQCLLACIGDDNDGDELQKNSISIGNNSEPSNNITDLLISNDTNAKPLEVSKSSTEFPKSAKTNFVKPDVREKLLNQNWELPKPQSISPLKTQRYSQPRVKMLTVSAQTSPKDLSFVQKLEHSEYDALLLLGEYNIEGILQGQGVFIPSEGASGDEGSSGSVETFMLHQSCQTEDLNTADDGLEEKITLLQVCFPGASRDDIQHILEKCAGNVEWASNILLDGGVQDTPTEQSTENLPSNQTDSDPENSDDYSSRDQVEKAVSSGHPSAAGSLLSIPSVDNLNARDEEISIKDSDFEFGQRKGASLQDVSLLACTPAYKKGSQDSNDVASETSPLPLMLLCHEKLLNQGPSSSDDKVLEQITEKNIQRYRSIEEFQHEHFTPAASNGQSNNLYYLDHLDPEDPDELSYPMLDLESYSLPPPVTRQIQETEELHQACAGLPSMIEVVNGVGATAHVDEDDPDDVILELTPQLAQQLVSLFGPVNAPGMPGLANDCSVVHLDRQATRHIHRCWENTVRRLQAFQPVEDDSEKIRMLKEDEALARQLQEEEDKLASASSSVQSSNTASPLHRTACLNSPVQPPRNGKKTKQVSKIQSGEIAVNVSRLSPARMVGSPRMQGGQKVGDIVIASNQSIPPPPSLREIMDEEQAIEASRQQYLESQDSDLSQEGSMSTNLKWQKLVEKFPGVDEQMLHEIFESTGYHMEDTVKTLEFTLARHVPVKDVMTQEAAYRLEEQMFRQAVEESLQHWPETEEMPSSEDIYQALEEPAYADFRAEATMHYKLRQQCFEKATDAYKKGMKGVASFYSQQGHVHSEKLKQANHRAAEKIVQYKNVHIDHTNSLDLHGLHVDEALKILEDHLAQREIEQRLHPDKRKTHLTVVTGRGTHSRGGVAKLRPAVLDFFRKNNYRWTEINASMLKVQLRFRDTRHET